MASSATSHSPAKWERTGEPGSAFRGLTRPGRGGRGRGGRRGGGRGMPSSQEPKIITEEKGSSSKHDSLLRTPNPSTKSHAQLSHAKSTSEKPSSLPAPPKRPPRRAPEVIPSHTNNVVPVAQSISSPNDARPSTRRRRSQTVKANANNHPQTSVTTSKVNELPPYKASIAPVPVLQIKDTPPHLKVHSDMRHNIDALVERVRAVAMENNRPTTPGSHIDWAGDDDDSLPDLDDWGVNTSTFASSASETISPIIVEGLKPLPDVVAPVSGTPLRQVINLDGDDVETDQVKTNALTAVDKDPISVCNTPIASKVRRPIQQTKVEPKGQPLASKLNSGPQPYAKPMANKKSLHPSLPAKPMSTSTVPPMNLRPGASPMRPTSNVKLPTHANKGDILLQSTCTAEPICTNPVGRSDLEDVPLIVEPTPIEEKKDADPRPSDKLPRLSGSDTSKSAAQSESVGIKGDGEEVPSEDDTKEGLEASIHAPKAGSTSAPAELSLYSQSTTTPQRNFLTHRKAQTVGKMPPFAPGANNEHHSRFTWSNDRGGRGRFHSTTHVRNHSSPPITGSPTHHRIHVSRPVLTGDAISRIARTIGNSNPTS